MSLLSFLCLLYLATLSIQGQGSFQTFKFSMEKKVKSISNAIQSIYATKCQNQFIRNCTLPSIHSCKGTDKRQCISNFPKSKKCSGTAFYSKKSVIRTPNWITPLNMSQQTKQFICSTAQQQFESVLRQILNTNDQAYAWSYFGSNDGSFRYSPGFKSPQSSPGICLDYDPRLRPWYAQNAFGRKNIIIIAQTSSTMSLNQGSRFNGMILSLNALIRTFDSDDFLNIIQFNNRSRSILNTSYLMPVSGNIEQRGMFYNAVASLNTSKNSCSNYQLALVNALQILKDTIMGNQTKSDCHQNLILMFADGNPDCGQRNISNLKAIIDKQSQKIGPDLSLSIFTFNLNKEQQNSNNSVMQQLSCSYGGMHFNIPQIVYQSQFITAAQGFFQFLSYGNQITQPSWSKIYTDISGLLKMTTVVFPAYLIQGSKKRLLGVSGIDVLVSQFKKYQPNQKQIQMKLSTEGFCFVKKIGGCQLQTIRDTKCNNFKCDFTTKINSSYFCEKKISKSSIFMDPVDSSYNRCCQTEKKSTNSAIIGITIAVVCLVLLSIGGLCYWKYMRITNLSYNDLKKFQDFDVSRIRTEQQISPIHD